MRAHAAKRRQQTPAVGEAEAFQGATPGGATGQHWELQASRAENLREPPGAWSSRVLSRGML